MGAIDGGKRRGRKCKCLPLLVPCGYFRYPGPVCFTLFLLEFREELLHRRNNEIRSRRGMTKGEGEPRREACEDSSRREG